MSVEKAAVALEEPGFSQLVFSLTNHGLPQMMQNCGFEELLTRTVS